jgi:hypothetical protein
MEVTITLLTLGPSMANKGYMPASTGKGSVETIVSTIAM